MKENCPLSLTARRAFFVCENTINLSTFRTVGYKHVTKSLLLRDIKRLAFKQQVNSKRNNYFAGQLGVEFKRQFPNGHYAARIGVKHAFTGANPELNFSYECDGNHAYTLSNNQDKTHFVLSIG